MNTLLAIPDDLVLVTDKILSTRKNAYANLKDAKLKARVSRTAELRARRIEANQNTQEEMEKAKRLARKEGVESANEYLRNCRDDRLAAIEAEMASTEDGVNDRLRPPSRSEIYTEALRIGLAKIFDEEVTA